MYANFLIISRMFRIFSHSDYVQIHAQTGKNEFEKNYPNLHTFDREFKKPGLFVYFP